MVGSQDQRGPPQSVVMESPAVVKQVAKTIAYPGSTPTPKAQENGNAKCERADKHAEVAGKSERPSRETEKLDQAMISTSSTSFFFSLCNMFSSSNDETRDAVNAGVASANDKHLPSTDDDITTNIIEREDKDYERFQKIVEAWDGKLPESFVQVDANAAYPTKSNDSKTSASFPQEQHRDGNNSNTSNSANPVCTVLPPNRNDFMYRSDAAAAALEDPHKLDEAAAYASFEFLRKLSNAAANFTSKDVPKLNDISAATDGASRILKRRNRDRSAVVRRLQSQPRSTNTTLLLEKWIRSHLKSRASLQHMIKLAQTRFTPFIFSNDATAVVEAYQQQLAAFFLQEGGTIHFPNDHNQHGRNSP